ncbi:hypothetical protein BH24ACT3_BH24ACT3_02610 [soil metagenome]
MLKLLGRENRAHRVVAKREPFGFAENVRLAMGRKEIDPDERAVEQGPIGL